jgi:hypothetical protein
MPLGMTWPITISYQDFHSSIQVLKGGYSLFLRVMKVLQPQLTAWLAGVLAKPTRFASPSFQFMDVYEPGFPSFETSYYPNSIMDS